MGVLGEFMSQDHDRLDAILADLKIARDESRARELFACFDEGLRAHIVWEEDLLFPAFESRTGMRDFGPTAVMRMEHEQIRECLRVMGSAIGASAPVAALLGVLTDHNYKEEEVLYPWLDQALSAEEAAALLERMRPSASKGSPARFAVTDKVGDIVSSQPFLSRPFERLGIDYCCGGQRTVAEACRERGLDARAVLAELETAATAPGDRVGPPPASLSLAELAERIEERHHGYLHRELPRLQALAGKVASVHGAHDARLEVVRDTLFDFVRELEPHMSSEERVVFPWLRGGQGQRPPLEFLLGQLSGEHERAGAALGRMRELTDGHRAPAWACNSYRALLDGLDRLERDMHEHVHLENHVLFPRALAAHT